MCCGVMRKGLRRDRCDRSLLPSVGVRLCVRRVHNIRMEYDLCTVITVCKCLRIVVCVCVRLWGEDIGECSRGECLCWE